MRPFVLENIRALGPTIACPSFTPSLSLFLAPAPAPPFPSSLSLSSRTPALSHRPSTIWKGQYAACEQ